MQPQTQLISLDAEVAGLLETALGAEERETLQPLASPRDFAVLLAREPQARALVALDDAASLDIRWWWELRAEAPQARLLIACRTCAEEVWRRWLVAGCSNVLRAPFTALDLEAEFANEPAAARIFRRHAELQAHGKAMFRYSIPSDPQYIPGLVHVVALLAGEFGFGRADCTMNLPLAVMTAALALGK